VKILRTTFLTVASAVAALHAQESGILPDAPDPAHPGPHDFVVRVSWSEVGGHGTIEMGHLRFTKAEEILEPARDKVATDPEVRIIFCPIGHVPLEFGKQIVGTLHQAGITRIATAMPEGVTLPIAKDAKATPAPGSQLEIRVMWSATDATGTIEIEGRKFTKPEEIIATLQERVKAMPDLRILLRTDRIVRYDYLKQIMAAIGKAGATRVTFSVADQNPPATAQ
jgi:biopolymer transport protein ExbD